MHKLKIVLLTIIVPIFSLFGQSIQYQKVFEDEFAIKSQSLIYCQDGNYLLCGNIYEEEDPNEALILALTAGYCFVDAFVDCTDDNTAL